jgi:hypothetical protein
MRKQLFFGAVFLFIFSILLSACGWRSVRGNGDIATITRNEGNFKSVKAAGAFDVFFSQADDYEIRIEADENLMQYILTTVEDGVLRLRTKNGVNLRPSEDIKVYLRAPQYESVSLAGSGNMVAQTPISSTKTIKLSIAGSGDIKLQEVNAPELHVNIAGSGKAEGSGATRVVDIDVAGSGDVMMKDLKAETAKINIAGSGNVWVYASMKLDVRVAGGGDIHYYGNPAEIKSKSAGSGNLIKE